MEIQGTAYLYTLATVMITFAGFSALLWVLRQAAGATVSRLDRFIAKSIMTYIFLLAAAALLPELLSLYDIPEPWIWRIAGVIFALPMLSLQGTYPSRRYRVSGEGPPPVIYAVYVALGFAVTLAMLVYVGAGLPHSGAAYITALTVDFLTVVFAFLAALDILMEQPTEAPKRRERR